MRDAAARPTRRQQWEHVDLPIVANFVADDLDQNDRDHNALWREQQRTNRLLFGVLMSTTGACILLAINIGIGAL